MSGESRCRHCGVLIIRNESGDGSRRWLHWDGSNSSIYAYYWTCKTLHATPIYDEEEA